jgi:hypothetical protein
LTDSIFFKDWPALQKLPRRAVAAPPPLGPLIAVIRDPARGTVKDMGETLLAPFLPTLRWPRFSSEGLLHEALGVTAVPKRPEIITVYRGGGGTGRRRQTMV